MTDTPSDAGRPRTVIVERFETEALEMFSVVAHVYVDGVMRLRVPCERPDPGRPKLIAVPPLELSVTRPEMTLALCFAAANIGDDESLFNISLTGVLPPEHGPRVTWVEIFSAGGYVQPTRPRTVGLVRILQ